MKLNTTFSALAAIALVGTLFSASPAAAAADGANSNARSQASYDSIFNRYPENITPKTESISDILTLKSGTTPPYGFYEVEPESSKAPAMTSSEASLNVDDITSVKESTFQTMWDPGSVIPSHVSAISEGEHVEMLMLEPKDRSSLMVLLVIDSAEAATEYQFKGAVPPGYSAELQSDGSVRFLDSDGNEAGGIMKPWAHDSNGVAVPTSFRLDGDTLVQTINHQDASHPIIADPWWVPVIVVAVRVAITIKRISTTVKVTAGTCAGHPGCRLIVTAVVDNGYRAGSTIYNSVRNYHGKSKGKG